MSKTQELIGTKLGRYSIVDHLATGGMAEIFLARYEAMGRFKKNLVLKVLQSRWEEHPEVVGMFLAEARISALMNHPNIVDVFDISEEGGRHFIAMEHIPGRTLTELAKRAIQVTKSIPIEVGIFIAAEIASALAYMYDGGGDNGEPFRVVHRDISPTNILISSSGQVKLIDFGIARQGLAVVEESGARPGKVTYMSPEQAKGAPIDGRSDIFCLGTILYEITLGRRLWRGPREVAVRRIVEERPKPPTFVRHDYPTELEIIVLRSLEKKPEDRYQSATELYEDLQNFLARSNAHLRNNFHMADYATKIFSKEADALISDAGRLRAQAFIEGSDSAEPDQADLDFDIQRSDGPGAALARTLRASALGVWAETGSGRSPSQPAEASEGQAQGSHGAQGAIDGANGHVEGEREPLFSESARDLEQAATADAVKRDAAKLGSNSAKREATGEVGGALPGETGEEVPAQVKASPEEDRAAEKGTRNGDPDRLPRRWNGIIIAGIVLTAAVVAGLLWWLHGG